MALSSIPVPPDPARDARAAALVDQVGSWPRFVLKEAWGSFEPGTTFRRAPSSRNPQVRYLVNSVACQCPDYADHHNVCKHVRAHALWEQRQAATAAPASVPRKSYADLFPACKGGCGDVADTRDGFCDRCASDREWRQRRAERHDRGVAIVLGA